MSIPFCLNSCIFVSVCLVLASALTGKIWLLLASVYSLQKFNNAFLRDKRHITKFFTVQILERLLFLALVLLSSIFLNISFNIVTLMATASLITTLPVFLIILVRKYSRYSNDKGYTNLW